MTEYLFDDTYEGPRYTYGLQYRPLQIGAQPKGYIIGSNRDNANFRHGTIQYPARLTDEQVKSYELIFVPSL